MAVPPVLFTIPMDMRLAHREVAVAQGLMRTLFPLSAMWGPLFVGIMEEANWFALYWPCLSLRR